MTTVDDVDELRVLIFAPVGRDAALTIDLLTRASLACHVCRTLRELCQEIERGAGCVLLTEEALDDPMLPQLATTLEEQPGWSDLSVLLFAGGERAHASLRTLRVLDALRNVTLLERPIRVAAVLSTVRAALRGRRRQHDLRDVMLQLRAARDEAEQANRLKDEFLATLSHELRTPLNAILGWISMLRRRQVDPEGIDRVLEVVERNAHAQAQLVADVLDVSRMVTGRLALARTTVSLPHVIQNAVDSVNPAAEARNIAVAIHLPPDLVPVFGDPDRLQQVFWNLLSNAVKFTPEHGRIEVRAVRGESQVEISFSDTGAGLSAEFLPFAFERFRQADQTFTRRHGGLGLGLAIVKHIVELHGGHVTAESAGVGQGSTFRVRLPTQTLVGGNTGAVDAGPHAPGVDADFDNRLILVVDEDRSTRELLTTLLRRYHARVVTALSVPAALECLEREVPALVLADIGMPFEDGLSLMKHIRTLPEHRGGHVPSLALSAYARSQDRARALEAGFDDFLAKPALPDDVVTTVSRLLEDRGGSRRDARLSILGSLDSSRAENE
jgi:signal transduction histidine kinase/ActR/RegA family two-component response regulator